jgi:lytic murein transglycosylase
MKKPSIPTAHAGSPLPAEATRRGDFSRPSARNTGRRSLIDVRGRLKSPLQGVALALFLASAAHAADAPDPARFAPCVAELKSGALARGVSAAGYERLTASLQPDLKVLDFLDYQPEFRTPIWDYLSGLVDEERVADGQAMLKQWGDTLNAVAARYKVDPATVVAVWGVESNFGRNFGSRPLLTSLSTLSCYGRRQAYFRGEFYDALKIVDAGDVKAEQLVGSWAGAFGHTQFMPSTFLRLAVDFDGDGRRDLVGSIPDALASTANFLKKAGWREDEVWGYEVRLPAGFDASGAGRRNKQALSAWAARGVKRIDGSPLAGDGSAGLLCPPAPRARPSWCSATSTPSTATTPPKATPWPSPTCPTACAAPAPSPPPGPPTTPACPGSNGAKCRPCSPPAATPSAPSTACSATPAARPSGSNSSAWGITWMDGRGRSC